MAPTRHRHRRQRHAREDTNANARIPTKKLFRPSVPVSLPTTTKQQRAHAGDAPQPTNPKSLSMCVRVRSLHLLLLLLLPRPVCLRFSRRSGKKWQGGWGKGEKEEGGGGGGGRSRNEATKPTEGVGPGGYWVGRGWNWRWWLLPPSFPLFCHGTKQAFESCAVRTSISWFTVNRRRDQPNRISGAIRQSRANALQLLRRLKLRAANPTPLHLPL